MEDFSFSDLLAKLASSEMLESNGVTENFLAGKLFVRGLKLLLSKFSRRGENRLSLEIWLLVVAPDRSRRGEKILSVESLESLEGTLKSCCCCTGVTHPNWSLMGEKIWLPKLELRLLRGSTFSFMTKLPLLELTLVRLEVLLKVANKLVTFSRVAPGRKSILETGPLCASITAVGAVKHLRS